MRFGRRDESGVLFLETGRCLIPGLVQAVFPKKAKDDEGVFRSPLAARHPNPTRDDTITSIADSTRSTSSKQTTGVSE
jgi:hypothetical protein